MWSLDTTIQIMFGNVKGWISWLGLKEKCSIESILLKGKAWFYKKRGDEYDECKGDLKIQ